jgi:hypothetical protein
LTTKSHNLQTEVVSHHFQYSCLKIIEQERQ